MEDCYARLDSALQAYADDEAACILGVSELDGFFHALGCAPQLIAPSVWLPAIWGGEAYAPKWPTMAAAQTFMQDAMAHYNSVMGLLAQGECAPLFLEDENGNVVVDEWCEGFLLGMFLWGDAADKAPDELLEPIVFFTVDLDAPADAPHRRDTAGEEEIELLQELIPQSVFGLREFFGVGRPPQAPRPPTGRGGKKGGKSRNRR